MDPRFRLRRRYPGERFNEPRALSTRLVERDRPLKEDRPLIGSSVSVGEPKIRASRSRVTAGPNAPLLKRLVLFPYRQETTRGRRQGGREQVPWDALKRESAPSIAQILAERPEPVLGSMVRAVMQRVVVRERPSADAWLGGRT